MNARQLTRSVVIVVALAGYVTLLPALRRIQVAQAMGASLPSPRLTEMTAPNGTVTNCKTENR